VVIGYFETHGRKETDALAEGLPKVPRRSVEYRGVTLTEMDLDAVLSRKAQLALVDELAHANALGSRHPKRYQDVREILDAGIDVFTTLNVQHVASRAEIVREVTGATIHETVPDSVVDEAEIELVDLPPDELLRRLAEGKVYMADRAQTAAANFFREGNLFALRELALRTGIDDIKALVAMLAQTERFGTSIAQSLRVHSDDLRTRRRQRAEEMGAKTTVKMVPPLVLFIFPALMVVILGPAILILLRQFINVF